MALSNKNVSRRKDAGNLSNANQVSTGSRSLAAIHAYQLQDSSKENTQPIQFTKSTANEEEHKKALEANKLDQEILLKELEKMQKSEIPIESNTARWFKMGLAKLYALTLTADSKSRAEQHKKQPDLAFFGNEKDVINGGNNVYNMDDMDDSKGIEFVPGNSGGFRKPTGGEVFITQPSRRNDLNEELKKESGGAFDPVTESLQHEVQHESDILFNSEFSEAIYARKYSAAKLALAEYRTEFRAYSAQDPKWLKEGLSEKEKLSMETLKVKLEYFTGGLLQLKLFLQIVPNYPKVKKAWEENEKVEKGKKFQEAVLMFTGGIKEISANPTNNPDVMNLWDSLNASKLNDPHKKSKEFIETAIAVPSPDRADILKAEPLWKQWLSEDEEYEWQLDEVKFLLSDDPKQFGKLRDEFFRKKNEKEKEESEEKEKERKKQAPEKEFFEKYPTWAEIKKLLEENKLMDNESIKDEFEQWSKYGEDEQSIGAFISNTFDEFNWWTIL
jgi:hypothetical protein